LIPGTLHALLAQRINNGARAIASRCGCRSCRPGHIGATPDAGCAIDAFPPPGANATKIRKGKLREMAEALLH